MYWNKDVVYMEKNDAYSQKIFCVLKILCILKDVVYTKRCISTNTQNLDYSCPIQWARGDVGLKPSAAARP